jgi:DNA-binding LytR/AlgR family response regulator
MLFNYFWNWQEWGLRSYGLIMKEFPLIMIFPLSLYFLIQRVFSQKKAKSSYITFQSNNGKDQLKIMLQHFLYANATENYISLHYVINGEIKKHLIRKTLKVLEKELKSYPEIIRVHRGYLINSQNIQAVKQKKGKIILEIHGSTIQVSKKYQSLFLKD